jgi:hypothetical protein
MGGSGSHGATEVRRKGGREESAWCLGPDVAGGKVVTRWGGGGAPAPKATSLVIIIEPLARGVHQPKAIKNINSDMYSYTPPRVKRFVAQPTTQRPRISTTDPRARHLSDASPGSGRDAREAHRHA